MSAGSRARPAIDWSAVERILVVRLRSIGDTVLATPSLIALRRFLPTARIDVLLEDRVAPLLDGFAEVDRVISVKSGLAARLGAVRRLRAEQYDVAINLHGGTTSTFLTAATGARHRIGYADYQYSFLYTHRVPPSSAFWGRPVTHSAEQQLALLGHAGVPVEDRPTSRLAITPAALASLEKKVLEQTGRPLESLRPLALLHPAASFATKTWAAENFATVADSLAAQGLCVAAAAGPGEADILERLKASAASDVHAFSGLSLPEITALASRAALFVGNDSGLAHIAAALDVPSVVLFGSSNRDHWRPWTSAPNEVVFEPFDCQPCPGYECRRFGTPRCIQAVTPERVIEAARNVLTVAAPPRT